LAENNNNITNPNRQITILNKGYINQFKKNNNIQILVLNPHRLRPSEEEKFNTLIY